MFRAANGRRDGQSRSPRQTDSAPWKGPLDSWMEKGVPRDRARHPEQTSCCFDSLASPSARRTANVMTKVESRDRHHVCLGRRKSLVILGWRKASRWNGADIRNRHRVASILSRRTGWRVRRLRPVAFRAADGRRDGQSRIAKWADTGNTEPRHEPRPRWPADSPCAVPRGEDEVGFWSAARAHCAIPRRGPTPSDREATTSRLRFGGG